jgi:hypothetical protein
MIAVAAALVAGAAVPAAANANANQSMVFEAPTELMTIATQQPTLDTIRGFGVTRVRQLVYWQSFAPRPNAKQAPKFNASDPNAYPAGTWTRLDNLVDEADAHGIQLQLTLTGPVPRWATSTHKGHTTRPNVKEWSQWVTAVGRRYGGRISTWSLWNEPNASHFLTPQRSHGTVVSGSIYRKLYLAGVKALRSTASNRGDTYLLGETAPRGNPNTTAPLTFLRAALCLNAGYHRAGHCAKLPASGYAHHAYTTRTGPRFTPPANDVTIGVLGRLTSALDRAARAGRIPKHLKLYLTEFGIQSFPDHNSGVPQPTQALYLAVAEHIAYSNPRVAEFSQYLLRDDRRLGGFQTGLETWNGRKKPAYFAFPIPLAVEHQGGSDALWGLVRPDRHATTVVVQRKLRKGGWKLLKTVHTSATGVYALRTHHRAGAVYRVRWTPPGGARMTGPAISAL